MHCICQKWRDNVNNLISPAACTTNRWAQFLKKAVPLDKKEFAMTNKIRTILILVTASMGIILIVGGIMTGKNGAVVVGLCVSAVAVQQLIRSRKKSDR